jgi:Protein of unknown function (DUF2934)
LTARKPFVTDSFRAKEIIMAKPFSARPATPAPSTAQPTSRTEVRNSPLPKTSFGASASGSSSSSSPGGKKQVSQDQIARRAYEIWQSGKGGSDFENWVRAERELRGS